MNKSLDPTGGAPQDPGSARCPGPSTRDIILADNDGAPKAITTEAYAFMGDADVPYDRYTSRAFFDAEMDKMWPKVWQMACREEHIPEVGDWFVYDVGRHSVLLVRHAKNHVKGYVNACMHRGMQLRPNGSCGSGMTTIRCPFHGFTWKRDGSLFQVPCAWDFPHISKETHRLDEVRVDTWGGFVFVNLDRNADPLEDYLEVMPEHFKGWKVEDRYVAVHVEKLLPANWKLAQEAFLEAFHVLATHPQGLPTAGDANAQYDVFGPNTNRFVHTIGFPSPHYTKAMTQQDILDALGGGTHGLKVKEGQTARQVFAQHLRETLGAQLGVDLSGYAITEMMDSIEYFCFPNFFVFPGVSLPMVYRFRPNGDDVDTCIFDLMFLRLKPEGAPKPRAPEPVKLGIADSFTTVEAVGPWLGEIYDQDVSNLDMQTKGIKASRKRGQTLGNYQEIRIRAMHKTLDTYLDAWPS